MSLVELELGADVHHERAAVLVLLDLPWGERVRLDAVAHERPAVQRDDVLEVRRLGTEGGCRLGHELPLVGEAQQVLVLALEADGRGHLHVHARPAAQRPAEMAGPDLARVRKREQTVP